MNGDRVIGGYALRRLLGRGGMGEVHLAATPTGGLAAVKVINPALARDPAFRRRFEREVAAARRVARFCTAPVLDAGIDGDVAYLVTEYVKGPSLAEVVRDQGPLSGGNLEALAVGIATALSAIHGAGVIHRDLKPSNVLLSPLGPRVIDFGIAQLVDHDSLASQAILGTPAFMAPEQVRGEVLTPAADVFAWGGVIAFAGTGRLPFGGGAPGEVLYRIMQEGPRLDGLDEGIREVVSRALTKDARLRPTAQGLLSELMGGTRLATATEVVERTWTGTPMTAPPIAASSFGARPADAPSPGARPAAGVSGGLGEAQLPRPPMGTHSGGVPKGGTQSGGTHSGGTQSGGAPHGRAPEGEAPHGGAHSGGAPEGRRRRRWWPWAAGVAAMALVGGAALAVPGLWQETWPYEADFGDAWAVGTSEGGNARQAGAGYELTVNPGWRLWKSAPRREPDGGVIVSTKATLTQGTGEYGVWCHGSAGSGDRYEFAVTGSGKITIVKRRTGTRGTTLHGPANTPVTAVNRIVAECARSGDKVTLRMWLNERLVAEASDADAPYAPDKAGVHAAAGATASARVRFDSFALRPADQ
ncbi:serine/threonine-protein kinase [Nonomuraea turcica]|uniref:serine/threonine-protein kinase n=1 Tax=Nonomuraea sp. G32 TaxID=3067274 RepID=UPI00273AF32D|nr:serine/threonine-protein kinase [Nonomuraea sp. G32]MDP4505587.1 serine/threonine-protein kinase [Nonomuraea sp. G32]